MMKRRAIFTAAAAATVLAACGKQGGDTASTASKEANGSTPVSVDTIAKEGAGFNVGSSMAARVVYVFFDPQCPHCAAMWEAARPLKSQARFVWIPVALLGDKSVAQGAAILAAADPVASMEQNDRIALTTTITAGRLPDDDPVWADLPSIAAEPPADAVRSGDDPNAAPLARSAEIRLEPGPAIRRL